VSAHWPLESRSPIARGINFVHKVVRRGLRWYINPIVEQQNAFNDTATRTLRLLADGYSDLLRQQHAAATPDTPVPADSAPPVSGTAAQTTPDTATSPDNDDTTTVQRFVEARAAAEPPARFPELAAQPWQTQLAQQQHVHAHWPLPAQTLPQRAAVLVQKGMRLYLRWLINPIVEQQNGWNTALAAAVPHLIAADQAARSMQAAQRAQRARTHRQ
jgi:hypothetical protein